MVATKPHLIPLWSKLAYSAFMAVLIPNYLKNSPTNFLYFCNVIALLSLFAIWLESAPLLSAMLIGAFVPQMLWVIDFLFEACGGHLTGLTAYMFDPGNPILMRFLSFYHFWVVFFLIYLVSCVGYDRRGLPIWLGIAWCLLTVCYVVFPPPLPIKLPGSDEWVRNPSSPSNINNVYGLSDVAPQQWMDRDLYFSVYLGCLLAIYLVTHLLLGAVLPGVRRRMPLAA